MCLPQERLRDVPRVLGFALIQNPQSVLSDDLPFSQRGFACRGGRDVQFFNLDTSQIYWDSESFFLEGFNLGIQRGTDLQYCS